MIELQNVEASYGTDWSFGPVSLKLGTGKTHVLLGSSGCGKTTLLKLILRSLPPRRGKVLVDATEIGYVPQESGLFPHLTVRDNITLVARLRKWKKELITKRLEELCHVMELRDEHMNCYPQELSGGQKQRAGLMRALMLDPEILLLDEPLGALDPIVRLSLQKQLKEIFHKLGKTVVIVTHDLVEAAYFADTITLLKDGSIMQHGTYSELRELPENSFVSDFLSAYRIPEVTSP